VEPEFGVANEPMNVQMTFKKKLQKDENPFLQNIHASSKIFCPLRGGFIIPRPPGVVGD